MKYILDKLKRKQYSDLIELGIVFAFLFMIITIYVPSMIWEEEAEASENARFNIQTVYDIEYFYKILTDKYESILLGKTSPDDGKKSNGDEPPVESSIPTGRFSGNGSQATRYRERYFNQRNFEALSIISNACKAKNITMVDATLRWMLHHSKLNDKLDGIIIGINGMYDGRGTT